MTNGMFALSECLRWHVMKCWPRVGRIGVHVEVEVIGSVPNFSSILDLHRTMLVECVCWSLLLLLLLLLVFFIL